MFARLSPAAMVRAHWKSLSDYRIKDSEKPDYAARIVILGAPVASAIAMLIFGGKLKDPDSLLTVVALLAGGFLAAFIHLSGIRGRLTEREDTWGDAERMKRDPIDESASHLIFASWISIMVAAAIIVGMNVSSDPESSLVGIWAAIATFGLVYLFALAAVTFPRLYSAYVQTNRVRDALNGAVRD